MELASEHIKSSFLKHKGQEYIKFSHIFTPGHLHEALGDEALSLFPTKDPLVYRIGAEKRKSPAEDETLKQKVKAVLVERGWKVAQEFEEFKSHRSSYDSLGYEGIILARPPGSPIEREYEVSGGDNVYAIEFIWKDLHGEDLKWAEGRLDKIRKKFGPTIEIIVPADVISDKRRSLYFSISPIPQSPTFGDIYENLHKDATDHKFLSEENLAGFSMHLADFRPRLTAFKTDLDDPKAPRGLWERYNEEFTNTMRDWLITRAEKPLQQEVRSIIYMCYHIGRACALFDLGNMREGILDIQGNESDEDFDIPMMGYLSDDPYDIAYDWKTKTLVWTRFQSVRKRYYGRNYLALSMLLNGEPVFWPYLRPSAQDKEKGELFALGVYLRLLAFLVQCSSYLKTLEYVRPAMPKPPEKQQRELAQFPRMTLAEQADDLIQELFRREVDSILNKMENLQ